MTHENNYGLKLTWPDGVTAYPIRHLSQVEAEEYVTDLQPTYDSEGRGVRITVVKLQGV